jgi:hypothetical protein
VGEVKITTIDYLKGVLEDFPEIIVRSTTSLATDHIFTVIPNTERKLLDEPRALAFHHSVAQLLFVITRSRKDIQTTVVFLATLAREPDEDEWVKMKRLLMYMKSTINMPLILRDDSLNVIKWWVDVSFATHDDCRRAHKSNHVTWKRINYRNVEETKN